MSWCSSTAHGFYPSTLHVVLYIHIYQSAAFIIVYHGISAPSRCVVVGLHRGHPPGRRDIKQRVKCCYSIAFSQHVLQYYL